MPESPISTRKALLFLLSYIKKHRVPVITGIGLLMLVDTFQLIIPRIIKRILDALGGQSFSSGLILKNALFIVALAGGMVVLRFFWRLCIFLPSRKIETDLRRDMFAHLLGLSVSFFNARKTGDLMALLINDLNAVRMATGPALIGLTDAVFMGSLSLVFMLTINVRLTLITVAPLPLIVVIMLKFGAVIQARFAHVQESFGELSSHTQEVFSGIRVVKGFVQEGPELSHFYERCNDYVDKNIRLVRLWGVFFPLMSFLASVSIALLFLFGGKQVILNHLSLGDFVSFTFYIQLFVWPMMATGWVFNILQRGIASVKRIMELMETTPDVQAAPPGGDPPVPIKGEILMRGLDFGYGDGARKVLRGIDLSIPAGRSLGIIGKPGSGKTTLVSLLFHLFPIGRGRLFIDGRDVNDIPLALLRGSIGYVPQDSFLFSDTLENNIALGVGEAGKDLAEVRRVSRIAAIEKDVEAFPKKYATPVGERGITLSGGQKQRLCIARALLIGPSILVLDDALSSVDAATEREILSGLREEIKGRTSIVIAHRVSTIAACDAIIVLDHGAIIERGDHRGLVAQNGLYAKLFRMQKLREEKKA